jgi:heme oxygenase (biliverdin-IX-beta and delta-forming)
MTEPSQATSQETPAIKARHLIRAADRAVLATSLRGWPYASLVLPALDGEGMPLLLLSDLAEHAKNLKADPHCSLLYDGTAGLADPLTGARVTVMGEARPLEDAGLLKRFVTRHPSAELYAGFRDFRLYRMTIGRAHLVAGFGAIHWVDGPALLVG